MIVGSGLIASCLTDTRDRTFYAAGVSNSGCQDEAEFQRDWSRLNEHLDLPGQFVYVSTCSLADSVYVRHKHRCERLVHERGNFLICRLPIVSGVSTNPHTLLNFLNSRIARSEKFDLYPEARRNVIDVDEIAAIVRWLVKTGAHNETINVAAPFDFSMVEIVGEFERLHKKWARTVYHFGPSDKPIDTKRIARAPVNWGDDYLRDIIERRYG
jgi:nucleoside-diphosphate-sugar epimerase